MPSSAALSGSVREYQDSNVSANPANTLTISADDLVRSRVLAFESALNANATTTATLPTVASCVAAGAPVGSRLVVDFRNANATYGVLLAIGTGWTLRGMPTLMVAPDGGRATLYATILTATTALGILVSTAAEPVSQSETIAAARTLTAADTGRVFLTDGTAGPFSITLPAPAAGLEFAFVVAVSTQAVTITVPTGASQNMDGVDQANAVETAIPARNSVAFPGGATAGDIIILRGVSSTQYMVQAHTSTALTQA